MRKGLLVFVAACILLAVAMLHSTMATAHTLHPTMGWRPKVLAARETSFGGHPTCDYKLDTDVGRGSALKAVAARSKEECCAVCQQHRDCAASVFGDHRCWLKRKKDVKNFQRKAGAVTCIPAATDINNRDEAASPKHATTLQPERTTKGSPAASSKHGTALQPEEMTRSTLSCFSGPDPVPVHRDGQCSGPSHPLGLWIQDAFVADAGFKKAYIIAQDMRKCNASEYWKPQKELYAIQYRCEFRVWLEAGGWGEAVVVESPHMYSAGAIVSQIIIQCEVPDQMRQYGDNALSASRARLSVVVTPMVKNTRNVVTSSGPVPSTNQLGLCAHPVDESDQTVSVAPANVHHKLSMCLWAADSYKDRFGIAYSTIVHQTPEWLEHHLSAGVEHFYVYDNSENDHGPLWQLLQPYVKQGLATYIRWPHKVCVPRRVKKIFGKAAYAHRSSQYAAGASCMRRYAQYNDWLAFFDVDEYLIPAGFGRPSPDKTAKPRLPATLPDVLAPYTSNPDVHTVSFSHTFHQPCGDHFDPQTHTEPMWQEGTGHRHFHMRNASDIGKNRKPDAQGDNAALFMEAYSCTEPPDRIHYCSRDGKQPCPPGQTRRSFTGEKQAVKPYSILYHFVHYPVVAYDGTLFKSLVKKHKRSSRVDPSFRLDVYSQAKMLHFRAQQAKIEGSQPDQNLTKFWLPKLRHVLRQPKVAKRLKAVQDCLLQKPLERVPAAQLHQQSTNKRPDNIPPSVKSHRPQIVVRGMKVRSEIIQWDAHRPDRDVVLAMASGYGMNEWRLFVGTLRRSGFDGDICIAVGKSDLQNSELMKYAKQMNIIMYGLDLDCHKAGRASACRIKDFYEQDQEDFEPVSNSRFQIYMALIQIYHKASVAFVTDFRDLFFVQNPFPLFHEELSSHSADILVFEEARELTIGMRGNNNGWNTNWIEKCYGKSVLSSLNGKSVYCSGTSAGLAGGMFAYFDAMINELTRLDCSKIPGADQGMHNYLIHTSNVKFASGSKPLTIRSIPQGKGPVNTLSALFRLRGPLASLGLIDEEGYVLNENKKDRSAVVHQWDRDPELKKWVKRFLLPQLAHSVQPNTGVKKQLSLSNSMSMFREAAKSLRKQFSQRYGGDDMAAALLGNAVRTYSGPAGTEVLFNGNNIDPGRAFTAYRILSAIVNKRPFVAAFAGYSTVVGRGNHLNQSYPLVFGEVLRWPMELLGVPRLKVRNAAIGGIPSFPYGWCMPNVLGDDADVVSWEFGKNEQRAADGFESFVRHSMVLNRGGVPPKFILMDDVSSRRDMIKRYNNVRSLADPIVVHVDDAVKPLLKKVAITKEPPSGVDNWDAWGADVVNPGRSCPGRSEWHFKLQAHELRAWVLAMHFLDAMELVADVIEANQIQDFFTSTLHLQPITQLPQLPEPISKTKTPSSQSPLTSLRFGVKRILSDEQQAVQLKHKRSTLHQVWDMNLVSCRTSFAPVLHGTLEDIVISGMLQQKDVLASRDDNLISSGWVLDVGELERITKIKVEKCGGLGYIDMKKALYGIHPSGKLSLWLPSRAQDTPIHLGDDATKLYKSLVICEVNEKRPGNVCKMERDLKLMVGGRESSSVKKISFTGAIFLGMEICVHVSIPAGAKVKRRQLQDGSRQLGLEVDVNVKNANLDRQGACSIAHVVWEETTNVD